MTELYALVDYSSERRHVDLNERVELLYAAGRYAEGAALLKEALGSTRGSVVNERGERVPVASGSGLPRSTPYHLNNLVAEDLSSQEEESVGDVPLLKRQRPDTPPHQPRIEIVRQNHPALATQDHGNRQERDERRYSPRPELRVRYEDQARPSQVTRPVHEARPDRNQQSHTLRTRSDDGKSAEGIEEEEQVKLLMASKKGRLVLRNGDVVENGRYLVLDEKDEMEKSLPLLSPVLTHWLKTFKSYIPLTVFNRLFLIDDQEEWSRRKAPKDSKIDDGSASLRVYGGAPPPEELAMQFEDWIDSMGLFIKYVADAGWQTLSERFEGHRTVVMDLRENYGWMIALRYCRKIRQGVMRETTDGRIKNFSCLQSAIFEDARLTADSRQERAYRTNPYAVGGPLAHLNPLTGLAKSSMAAPAKKTIVDLTQPKTGRFESSSTVWIPSHKWRLLTAEEKKEAKRTSGRRDSGGGYQKRSQDDDRGRDRYYTRSGRYNKRSPSRSRSRSPRGKRGKGGNGRS